MLIAESDRNDPRIVAAPPVGPGLDAVWADDLHHCLHVELTGEHDGYYEDVAAGDLELALVAAQTHQGRYSVHRRRSVGRPVDGTSSGRFVVSLQNHDQVGNRAAGERLHHLVGIDRTAAAAALVLLGPFAVLLFQGEEWAASSPFPYFSDHSGELGEAVRQGRRAEFAAFGWSADAVADPQSRDTSDRAVLDWHELDDEPHSSVHDWYRSLLALRRTHPSLDPRALPDHSRVDRIGGVVSVRRGTLQVIANLGPVGASWPEAPVGPVLLERGDVRDRPDGILLAPGAVRVTELPVPERLESD